MFYEIKESEDWAKILKINKGWSEDIKYYIETEDHQKLLLKIAGIDKYEEKKREYNIICKYSKLGFEMSKPVSFGKCNKQQNSYILLTWVEGEDLDLALPKLEKSEQYKLGIEAGAILRKIHEIKVPSDEIPKETKIPKKKLQIERYINSKVRISADEVALNFIDNNIDKMWSLPPVYQHGDFHPGNLILTPNKKIGVIDFSRFEIGDPYEEFYKLESFGTEISIPFCVGQINGYFNGKVPKLFWEVLAVYVAHASLYSIKWSERFGKKDIEHMIKICKRSFLHYDNFKRKIPIWYSNY